MTNKHNNNKLKTKLPEIKIKNTDNMVSKRLNEKRAEFNSIKKVKLTDIKSDTSINEGVTQIVSNPWPVESILRDNKIKDTSRFGICIGILLFSSAILLAYAYYLST